MLKKSAIMALGVALVLMIAAPAVSYAGNKIPTTAINEVLDLQFSLNLTDAQITKLAGYNAKIVDKMIQTRGQAEIRKSEIDEFTSDWSKLHGLAASQLVKEYYGFMADYKELELEAIMKARAVLTQDQMRNFIQLASIQNMMMKLETEVAAAY